MMKHNVFKTLILFILISSCSYKNSYKKTEEFADKLHQDDFNLKGTYFWKFNLMGTEQISIHSFFSNRIDYEMQGKVHATKYSIQKLSYDKNNQKWIGEDKKGIVYVLFFKDLTKNTISIYKHKCKSKGLEEAIAFKVPSNNTTDDHGWNIYTLNKVETIKKLPISGNFSSKNNKIIIKDSEVKIGNKTVSKMSFHLGERRWVGKYKNEYLQLFFKELNNDKPVQISIEWFNDLEKLYKTKHNSVTNWKTYERE